MKVFFQGLYLVKIVLTGDIEQIDNVYIDATNNGLSYVVERLKEENINWLNSKMFNNLCDGNLIKLIYNKRNNETPNYNKIFNNEKLDEERYIFRPPQHINICRTNLMRIKINDMCMDKKNYCKFIEAGEGDKEQDIYLNFDTPIMCIKNNKKLNIKNGSMNFKLTNFTEKYVYVNDIEFTNLEFTKHFVVAYCVTNHKVQGITIRQPYNIYEWHKMDNRAKYTAYSRTADKNLVRLL